MPDGGPCRAISAHHDLEIERNRRCPNSHNGSTLIMDHAETPSLITPGKILSTRLLIDTSKSWANYFGPIDEGELLNLYWDPVTPASQTC